MQAPMQPTASRSSFFASGRQHVHALFTAKRAGFTILSAFAFAGAAAAIGTTAGSHDTPASPSDYSIQHTNAGGPTDSAALHSENPADTPPSDSSGSATTHHSVNLQVNGQSIAVPPNGSVQRSVPTADGSGQSSVSVNSSSTSSGSSVNVNISSTSTTSGDNSNSSSTFISQNGNTTFVSGN